MHFPEVRLCHNAYLILAHIVVRSKIRVIFTQLSRVSILLAACAPIELTISPTLDRVSEWVLISVTLFIFADMTAKLAARLRFIIFTAAPPDCTTPSRGMRATRPIEVLVVFVVQFTILAYFLWIYRLSLLVA